MIRINCGICVHCSQPAVLEVNDDALGERIEAFMKAPSTHIQYALPELTPGQREMLISGVHEACFDEMFKEED